MPHSNISSGLNLVLLHIFTLSNKIQIFVSISLHKHFNPFWSSFITPSCTICFWLIKLYDQAFDQKTKKSIGVSFTIIWCKKNLWPTSKIYRLIEFKTEGQQRPTASSIMWNIHRHHDACCFIVRHRHQVFYVIQSRSNGWQLLHGCNSLALTVSGCSSCRWWAVTKQNWDCERESGYSRGGQTL